MVELRFRSDEVWRDCCDLVHMMRRWGQPVAHRVSRRLQQLEAMATAEDLWFLPFASVDHDDGVIEIEVTDGVSIFAVRGSLDVQGDQVQALTITAVRGSTKPATL